MKQDNRQESDDHKAMAEAAIAVLDTRFLKALTDVTRVQILKKLIVLGTSDVTTIAAGLSQDRSVISRHLRTLEEARITRSRKVGRHVQHSIDGPYVVEKVTLILDAVSPMADLCVPFQDLEDGAAA